MKLATYEVDLYGEWEREGYQAQSFIDYMMGRGAYLLHTDDFELVDAQVTREDHDHRWGTAVKQYGTVHIRMEMSADNGTMALRKAKGKVTRWLRDHTCSPPKIKWL